MGGTDDTVGTEGKGQGGSPGAVTMKLKVEVQARVCQMKFGQGTSRQREDAGQISATETPKFQKYEY